MANMVCLPPSPDGCQMHTSQDFHDSIRRRVRRFVSHPVLEQSTETDIQDARVPRSDRQFFPVD